MLKYPDFLHPLTTMLKYLALLQVNFDDFIEVLSQFGLRLEKPLLGAFLSRCSIRVMGKGVPYREFLHRFQDRSEAGMVHNVLTDVNHR